MTGIIIRQVIICMLCFAIGYVAFPFLLERKIRKHLESIMKPNEKCLCPVAAILIDEHDEISWVDVMNLPETVKNTEE